MGKSILNADARFSALQAAHIVVAMHFGPEEATTTKGFGDSCSWSDEMVGTLLQVRNSNLVGTPKVCAGIIYTKI